MGILVEGSTGELDDDFEHRIRAHLCPGDKEDKENAEFTGPMLKCIVQVAQDIYSTGMLSHRHICSPSCLAETSVNLDEQVGANRQFLEGIQNQFLLHVEAVERRQSKSVDDPIDDCRAQWNSRAQ